MKFTGIITQIRRSRSGITLLVDIGMGLRGVELDHELWDGILKDFGRAQDRDLVGWAVEYDPERGDLEITGAAGSDDPPGQNQEHPEQA